MRGYLKNFLIAYMALQTSVALGAGWSEKNWLVVCIDPDPCAPADEIYAPLLGHASRWLDGLGFPAPDLVSDPAHPDVWTADISDSRTDDWDVNGAYVWQLKKLFLRSDQFFTLGESGQEFDDPQFQHRSAFQFTPVHELFHAIQNTNLQLSRIQTLEDYHAKSWITEGTASAVQQAYADEFGTDAGARRETRSFSSPLNRPQNLEMAEGGVRGTWIFWRDVGRQIGSSSDIAYLKEIIALDLNSTNGIEEVDSALPRGLAYHLPRFYAGLEENFRLHFEPGHHSAPLSPGETWKTHRFPMHVRALAGQGAVIQVTSATANQVKVLITPEPNDAVFHLIVDGQLVVPDNEYQRNLFRTTLDGGQSKEYKVILANVAETASTTVARDVILRVELREEGSSYVKLNGELFEIKTAICNSNGVISKMHPTERTIFFSIRAPGGSTRVAWNDAGIGAVVYENGCSGGMIPMCKSDLSWNAGGNRPAHNPPENFRVEMDYDSDAGIWTGAGTLASHSAGIVPVEFSIQCTTSNRKILR